MDEILHTPDEEALSAHLRRVIPETVPGAGLARRIRGGVDILLDGAELLRRRASRLFHRIDGMTMGGKHWGPAAFMAVAGILGVTLVVGTVYTPSYVVSVDGVALGTVEDPRVFEEAKERVEARASTILGYDYKVDSEITYELALIEKDTLSPVGSFETYLFNRVGEVMKSYVLTVDGVVIGGAADKAQLTGILDAVKAGYTTENTVEAEFVEGIFISHQFTASDILQDPNEIWNLLTENTSGETTYTVRQGDTFSAIAYANNMGIDELQALNPGIDINMIYVGQVLTVREVVPFLSVRTVDTITYSQEIPSPVREVNDNTMYQGDRKTVATGTPGEALITADVTYLNGVEKGRSITAREVVTEATETVIHVGTKQRPKTMATGKFIWPLNVRGNISSQYGYRTIFGSYQLHSGVDIGAAYGSTIKAADGGKVIFAGAGTEAAGTWSYGNYVVIDHENGLRTIYAHCSSLCVSAGQRVYQGQTIAKVGSTGRSTGNHLHFEVRLHNQVVSPWNYVSQPKK